LNVPLTLSSEIIMHPTTTDAAFQPYGFLLAGRRRSPCSSPDGCSTPSAGARTPPEGPADLAFMTTEHAKHLAEHLEFIVPPHINPVEHDNVHATGHCLFIGHLRFETTTADVRWMVHKLSGVIPVKAEVRGNGCCVVYLASEKDEREVQKLNRRILFDHQGIWFARTDAAVAALSDYVERVLPKLGNRRRCLRLPRDSIVVEESRSAKKGPRRPSQLNSKEFRAVPHPSGPPSPYSLGSPAIGGFHLCPPDYALPHESNASSMNAGSPPPYHLY
jgi:hypothetical protein